MQQILLQKVGATIHTDLLTLISVKVKLEASREKGNPI
jgi:hypothetical protein